MSDPAVLRWLGRLGDHPELAVWVVDDGESVPVAKAEAQRKRMGDVLPRSEAEPR